MKISIAVPAFDDGEGQGAFHLGYQFDKLLLQTHTDFNVVISDHSDSPNIKDICEEYSSKLDIKYLKYTEDIGYWGSNLNNAMKNCDGDIIKTMLLDDFLLHDTSLETINKIFSLNDPQWVMCGGVHTQDYITFYNPVVPEYHQLVHRGMNKLGGPSGLSVKNNKSMLFFEERLNWVADCDYYKRSYMCFGEPLVIPEPLVVYKQWEGQMTNTLSENIKSSEIQYLINKFEK